MGLIIVILIIAIVLFLVLKQFKNLKSSNVSLVTGQVKAGKSTIGCYLAVSKYKSALFNWRIKCLICKLLKKDLPEKPLIYSNVPLACEYSPLTSDILLRKKRMRFGSVAFVDEASLIASNDTFRDMTTKERLEYFNKLFAHATHGGYMFYNTQAIGDLSIEIRRCSSQVFYVHHLTKWLPFVLIAHVRECVYNEDGLNVTNNFNEDAEESFKKVIIPKKIFNMFDRYAFSWFTDDLQVSDEIIDGKSLPDLKVRQVEGFDGYVRNKENFYKNEVTNENKKENKQFVFKL